MDKRHLIEKAVTKLGDPFYDKDHIYELRYDKAAEIGINAYTNHALHIVTNDKNYKTENQGLNFTFPLDDEDIEGFLFHYYNATAFLLLYTSAVIDNIVFDLIDNRDGRKELKFLQRTSANMMLFDFEDKKFSNSMYRMFSKMMVTECEICKNVNKFNKRDFEGFFWDKFFSCKRCSNEVMLSDASFEKLAQLFNQKEKS